MATEGLTAFFSSGRGGAGGGRGEGVVRGWGGVERSRGVGR